MNELITFELIPLNFQNNELVETIKDFLVDVFQSEVIILPQKQIPPQYRNVYRGQYEGFKLLQWLSNLRNAEASTLVGVADVDAYVSGLNFIFGIADPKSRAALVFLERLKESNDSLNIRFISRVKKEVLHEVGHVLGLRHCINRKCVMVFSNSLYDTDFKEFKYCESCYALLNFLGYSINSKYLLSQ
ncbi:MAG: archaemetzincin family Zn-dependent metalloprotease [Sulfolobales archaeon]